MPAVYSLEEVSNHNKSDDCWLIIDKKVYNVTSFLNSHPGGKKPILNLAGKDATKEFNAFHNAADVLQKFGSSLYIGDVASSSETQIVSKNKSKNENGFGSMIPYSDPTWYHNWHSPYYTDRHRIWRAAIREFVEKEIMPFVHEWDEAKTYPKDLLIKCHKAGFLAGVAGPPWPVEYAGDHLAGGIRPEEYDAIFESILIDEASRCGSGGILWGAFAGLSIGLAPILLFGSQYLKDKVCRDCLSGQKMICLAITEPAAGSDVAHISTTAKRTEDGKFFIVNGEKKFITNGIWADYFTVAVKHEDHGMHSLLLLERGMPGITTRQMQCSGVWSSGTTYITFEDVKVPVENMIGDEGYGFKYIMYNFNHERWSLCVEINRFARVCLEEAFKYAHKRKTFGKRLIDHPVIRLKMGHMIRMVESTQSWLENITYQLTKMSHEEAWKKLGGPIALLKAQCTQTFEFCAREAFQIFGGLAYTRGSQGEKVERLYREVRAYAIAGGSEEIMIDFGVRQAVKQAKL